MENQNEKNAVPQTNEQTGTTQENFDQTKIVSVDDRAANKVKAVVAFKGSRAQLEAEEETSRLKFKEALELENNLAANMYESVSPYSDNKRRTNIAVSLPSDTTFRRTERLSNLTKAAVTETQGTSTWGDGISASSLMLNSDGWQVGALTDEVGTYTNRPTFRGKTLNPQGTTPKMTSGTKRIGGTEASTLMNHFLGNGTTHKITLWHSGFQVRVAAPKDVDIIALNERIASARLTLGRQVGDVAYSSTTSVVVKEYFDFFVDHVVSTNLQNNVDWQNLISHADVQLIAHALGLAMFPDGFNYSRSTLRTDGMGVLIPHEETARINLADMVWVRPDSLTELQRETITHSGSNLTREQVLRYQADFIDGDTEVIELNESIKVRLRMPSLMDFISSSQNWFSDLDEIVNEGFKYSGEDAEQKRWMALQQQQAATYLRRFSHYVDEIIMHDGESVYIVDEDEVNDADDSVNKRKSIEQLINQISGKEELVDTLIKGIVRFQNTRVVAVVGYCTDEPLENEERIEGAEHLVAIDAVSLFFTLVLRKSHSLMKDR